MPAKSRLSLMSVTSQLADSDSEADSEAEAKKVGRVAVPMLPAATPTSNMATAAVSAAAGVNQTQDETDTYNFALRVAAAAAENKTADYTSSDLTNGSSAYDTNTRNQSVTQTQTQTMSMSDETKALIMSSYSPNSVAANVDAIVRGGRRSSVAAVPLRKRASASNSKKSAAADEDEDDDDSVTAMMRRYLQEDDDEAPPHMISNRDRESTHSDASAHAARDDTEDVTGLPAIAPRAYDYQHQAGDGDNTEAFTDAAPARNDMHDREDVTNNVVDDDGELDVDAVIAQYDARSRARTSIGSPLPSKRRRRLSARSSIAPASASASAFAGAADGVDAEDEDEEDSRTRDALLASKVRGITSLADLYRGALLAPAWDKGRRESELPLSLLLRGSRRDDDDSDDSGDDPDRTEDATGAPRRRSRRQRRQSTVMSVALEEMGDLLKLNMGHIHEADYIDSTRTVYERLQTVLDSAELLEKTLVADARAAISGLVAEPSNPFAAIALSLADGGRRERGAIKGQLERAQDAASMFGQLEWMRIRSQGLAVTRDALATQLNELKADVPDLERFSLTLKEMRAAQLANADPVVAAARNDVLARADAITAARATAAAAELAAGDAAEAHRVATGEIAAAEARVEVAEAEAAAERAGGVDPQSAAAQAEARMALGKTALSLNAACAGWSQPTVTSQQHGNCSAVELTLAPATAPTVFVSAAPSSPTAAAGAGSTAVSVSPAPVQCSLRLVASAHTGAMVGPAELTVRRTDVHGLSSGLGFSLATAFTAAGSAAAAAAAATGMTVAVWQLEQSAHAALVLSLVEAARPQITEVLASCIDSSMLTTTAAQVKMIVSNVFATAAEITALCRHGKGFVSVAATTPVKAASVTIATSGAAAAVTATAAGAATVASNAAVFRSGFPTLPITATATAVAPAAAFAVPASSAASASAAAATVSLTVTHPALRRQLTVTLAVARSYGTGAAGALRVEVAEALAHNGGRDNAAALRGLERAAEAEVGRVAAAKGFRTLSKVFASMNAILQM